MTEPIGYRPTDEHALTARGHAEATGHTVTETPAHTWACSDCPARSPAGDVRIRD